MLRRIPGIENNENELVGGMGVCKWGNGIACLAGLSHSLLSSQSLATPSVVTFLLYVPHNVVIVSEVILSSSSVSLLNLLVPMSHPRNVWLLTPM